MWSKDLGKDVRTKQAGANKLNYEYSRGAMTSGLLDIAAVEGDLHRRSGVSATQMRSPILGLEFGCFRQKSWTKMDRQVAALF